MRSAWEVNWRQGGAGMRKRKKGWWGGVGVHDKNKTKTDKECQALQTGMLQLCVSHLATSPPHHLPPPPPLPHLPLCPLIQQICSKCMAAPGTKRILCWGAKDVGLGWTRHSATHWPARPFSAHTKERGTKTLKEGGSPTEKTFACNCVWLHNENDVLF